MLNILYAEVKNCNVFVLAVVHVYVCVYVHTTVWLCVHAGNTAIISPRGRVQRGAPHYFDWPQTGTYW